MRPLSPCRRCRRLNNGEPSKLVFARSHLNALEGDVLRFWPTHYAVRERPGAAPRPIWLGSVVHERIRRSTWPFNVLRPARRVDPMAFERGDDSPWGGIEIAKQCGMRQRAGDARRIEARMTLESGETGAAARHNPTGSDA